MRQKAELTKQNAKHLQGKQQKQKELNEIDECNQLLNSLLKQAEAHRQTLVSQKATLRERDQTLLSKSKRIEKLLVKTQELEKFKFVLDYKIKELKKDVKPNNEVSAQLKEQTTKMEQEVKHFSRVKTNMQLIVKDLQLKMAGLIKEQKDLFATLKA